MNNYYPQDTVSAQSLDSQVSRVMKQVYAKMFLALVVSALTALVVPSIPGIFNFVQSGSGSLVLLLLEVGLVIWISAGINRMSGSTATLLFYLFAIVNGAVLSIIGLVYSPGSIMKTFFITAGTFGAMSIYGYFTEKDLTKIGTFLIFALFGLIICSLVNYFTHSDTLAWIISIAGVLVFLGLTAWDTQQIKRMALQMPNASDGRLATIGALSLYLDFINLFLYLLRFFGNSRN